MIASLKRTFAAAVIAMVAASPLQAAQLVMVDSRGCTYCAKFNREVAPKYSTSDAGKLAPLRKVSPVKRWPADLKGVRPVHFTPVFILVNDGREVGRFAGYNTEAKFWSRLQPLLAKLR